MLTIDERMRGDPQDVWRGMAVSVDMTTCVYEYFNRLVILAMMHMNAFCHIGSADAIYAEIETSLS